MLWGSNHPFLNGGGDSRLPALNACWFIYALIIIKITFNYVPLRIQYLVMLPISVLTSILWHKMGFYCYSAWSDAVVAYPFFIGGYYIKRYITTFDRWKPNCTIGWTIALVSLIALFIIPTFNSWPMMYRSQYGNNYILFILGAMSGTYLLFFVSRLIGNCCQKYIKILSIGNILTLGIHSYPVLIILHFHIVSLPICLLLGLAIMMIMYPIINYVLSHMPFVIGRTTK